MYFSDTEKERRHGLLREKMKREGIDCLLVIGTTANGGSVGPGSFRYLTDFFLLASEGLLLFFADSDPVLWVVNDIHEHHALKKSWIKDVRISSHYAPEVAAVLKQRKKGEARLGVSSLKNLSASIYDFLRKDLPSLEFIDADPVLLEMRIPKSPEEQKMLTQAADIVDQGFRAVLTAIKPGVTERELVGVLEGVHRGKGCDRTFNLISSGAFPRPNKDESAVFMWYPSAREIKKGDVIVLEMTAAYAGYWNQLVRAVGVGEKNQELFAFHQALLKSIKAGVDTMKPGIRTSDYVDAMGRSAEAMGYTLKPPVGHYAGLDLIEARVNPGIDVILKQGASAIIHPTLDRDGVRLFWGETYLAEGKGALRLNTTGDELIVVS